MQSKPCNVSTVVQQDRVQNHTEQGLERQDINRHVLQLLRRHCYRLCPWVIMLEFRRPPLPMLPQA